MAYDKQQQKAQRDYPGAAVDKADDGQTTEKEVKQRTRTLNNNPRNTDNVMPDRE